MADEKLDETKGKQETKETTKLPEPQDKIVTTQHSLENR